jgi:hypothetical protein
MHARVSPSTQELKILIVHGSTRHHDSNNIKGRDNDGMNTSENLQLAFDYNKMNVWIDDERVDFDGIDVVASVLLKMVVMKAVWRPGSTVDAARALFLNTRLLEVDSADLGSSG